MALKDVAHIQNLLTVLHVLLFVAENCVAPFLPLYLKYLGLPVLEMSLIRAFGIIITLLVIPFSVYIMKLKNWQLWRAHCICFSLLASFGACVILAIYLKSGAHITLINCGSTNKQTLNVAFKYIEELSTVPSTKTETIPTNVSEPYSTIVQSQNSSIRGNNSQSVKISQHSGENNSKLNFYQDLKRRLPGNFNSANNFSTTSGQTFATNKYRSTSEVTPDTQYFQTLSSSPMQGPLFMAPTTSSTESGTKEVSHSRRTDTDENLEDIFYSGDDSPRQQITHVELNEKDKKSDSNEYNQETGYYSDSDSEIQTKTRANFKYFHVFPTEQSSELLPFVGNSPQKYYHTSQVDQLENEESPRLKMPTKTKLSIFNNHRNEQSDENVMNNDYMTDGDTLVNWESAPKYLTNDHGGNLHTSTTRPTMFTVTQATLPRTSQRFAADHFKKLMDFWKHHRSHVEKQRGSISNDDTIEYSDTSDTERKALPNYQKLLYPKFHTVSANIQKKKDLEKKIHGRYGAAIPWRLSRRIKRNGNDLGTLGQDERQSYNRYDPESGNTATNTGEGRREPQSSDHRTAEVTATHENSVEAVPAPTHGDTWEVFVGAAVVTALHGLWTSVAAPCVQELWRQTSGRQLPARSPVQLGVWSACACVVLLAVVSQPCGLQGTVHCAAAAVVFVLALLLALVALPPVARRARPDKAASDVEDSTDTSEQLAFVQTAGRLVSGFLSACSCEFMLWHVSSLAGFPFDYEVLYCGYVSLAALAEGAARSCRCDGYGCVGTAVGHALLAAHFLAASGLGDAWLVLAVAPLYGAGSAQLRPAYSAVWVLGYTLGCLSGGLLASYCGIVTLFLSCATASCICCIVTISTWGCRSCQRNPSYTHLLLAADERDGADSPAECDDWLERAMLEEERHSK